MPSLTLRRILWINAVPARPPSLRRGMVPPCHITGLGGARAVGSDATCSTLRDAISAMGSGAARSRRLWGFAVVVCAFPYARRC